MAHTSPRSHSPVLESPRMAKKWARTCERYCCLGATYFPLVFVYSITTWAVWVEATIGFLADGSGLGTSLSFQDIAMADTRKAPLRLF